MCVLYITYNLIHVQMFCKIQCTYEPCKDIFKIKFYLRIECCIIWLKKKKTKQSK